MLIAHLRTEFAARTLRNPRYSLRAFAKSLDVDASTLSALLRNKRPLSAKTAKKLIDGLDIQDPAQRRRIFTNSLDHGAAPEPQFSELDLETFEVISSWEHFAILAFLEISDAKTEVRAIAKALDISIDSASQAVARLEGLGLIKKISGKWGLTGRNLSTPSNTPSAALRKNNRQHIELSLASLERDPIDRRDITGITMAIDPQKLPEAQKLIKEFRRSLSAYLESGNKQSVYRLNIQLFPLSRD